VPHETETGVAKPRNYTFRKTLPAPFSCKGAGIYALLNCLNGKIYIGSAVRLNHRRTEHRTTLEDGTHGNRYLQRAFTKDPDAFQIAVIELIAHPQKASLLAREQFWIDFYRSAKPENGYNIAPKAQSCQGIKRDPEFVARCAESLRGYKHTAEAIANMTAARQLQKRKKYTPEQRANVSEGHKGLKWKAGQKEKRARTMLNNPKAYNQKRVDRIGTDGTVLESFRSVKEAEVAFGARSNIHAVCKGKRNFCFGFRWRYSDAT